MKNIILQKIHVLYTTHEEKEMPGNVIINKDNITIVKNDILDIYKFSFNFLGSCNNTINIYIHAGTKEFNELQATLSSEMSLDNKLMHIEEFANKVSLKYIPSDRLLEIIEEVNDENFTEGYQKAQANIREALGIK